MTIPFVKKPRKILRKASSVRKEELKYFISKKTFDYKIMKKKKQPPPWTPTKRMRKLIKRGSMLSDLQDNLI